MTEYINLYKDGHKVIEGSLLLNLDTQSIGNKSPRFLYPFIQDHVQQGDTRILMLIQHVTEYINLYNDGHSGDIIVLSSTWREHLERLKAVFERLRRANLKLGAAKCHLAAREVSFLGYKVTPEGLEPEPKLILDGDTR